MSDGADPDAEVWSYTFGEKGPDFVLTICGETIGRVYLCTTRPGGYVWLWSILCSFHWGDFDKPPVRLNGDAPTKAGAIEGLRASWAIEREWRRKAREITVTTHGCWSPWMLDAVWRGYEKSPPLARRGSVTLARQGINALAPAYNGPSPSQAH